LPEFRHQFLAISAILAIPKGAVAQLGERLLCKQEVTGSIPVSSTNFTPSAISSQHSVKTKLNAHC
jgi:hypothetical protein